MIIADICEEKRRECDNDCMTSIQRVGMEGKYDHDYILTMMREKRSVSVIMPTY